MALLAGLKSGRSGLRPCHFGTADLRTHVGEITGLADVRLEGKLTAFDCRNNRLAEMALRQDGFGAAVSASSQRHGAHRIGIFLGTSTSGILQSELAYRVRDPRTGALPAWFDYERTHNTYSLAGFLTERLGLRGPSVVVSCACASTAKAFGSAARMIEAGICDAAIVGGADSLCLTTLYGFQSLNLTAAGPCRPFDANRDGISIGEAAGFALLERAELGTRDDDLLLLGIGESNDAYHMSSPHPEGAGARLAMERALASAGLGPADIDYLNLHGTATLAGDAAEDRAVFELFGGATPCSSTKGQTGHTLGAAGIVEAIISLLAIRHGIIPGCVNTVTIDPGFRSRHLTTSASARLDVVMSNSFGFGGSNCSLILGRTR
jgi:3-oxoacyl-[acyl-carrier-protein] synthase-1